MIDYIKNKNAELARTEKALECHQTLFLLSWGWDLGTRLGSRVPKVQGARPFKGRMCLVDSQAKAGAALYPADRHRRAVGAALEAISVQWHVYLTGNVTSLKGIVLFLIQ